MVDSTDDECHVSRKIDGKDKESQGPLGYRSALSLIQREEHEPGEGPRVHLCLHAGDVANDHFAVNQTEAGEEDKQCEMWLLPGPLSVQEQECTCEYPLEKRHQLRNTNLEKVDESQLAVH